MKTTLFLEQPDDFNFKYTVYSHGWSVLAPFRLDTEQWCLSYVFEGIGDKDPVAAEIRENKGKISIEIENMRPGIQTRKKILHDIAHILRFDENLIEFHTMTKKEKSLRWVSPANAGRLLRSPTVFEDLVKTICTTNCSWGLTKNMTSNLVNSLGETAANGQKTFPTPEAMADRTEEFYRKEIRAGYRSPFFVELAEAVASGRIKPETWLKSDLPTPELKKEMKKIKGVGDYAAENLLKLVGRYDGLALDSWLRAQFYKKHNDESPCDDGQITDYYSKFGAWSGLAIWMDMSGKITDIDT